MNWNQQAETMTKVWSETQKKLWENWYDLAHASRAPVSTPFSLENVVDEWSNMATQGFEAWTAHAEPTAKETARRLFASQKSMMQFLEYATEVWKSILAKTEAGEAWQAMLTNYTEQFRQQLTQSSETLFKIGQDTSELWQLYQTQVQKLAHPWLEMWQHPTTYFGKDGKPGGGQTLLNLTNLYWDSYDQTFGQFLESPTLGLTRELEAKIRKGFNVWQHYRRADFEYQLVVIEAWVKSFEQLQSQLISLSEQGEKIRSVSQLATVWTNVAEAAFGDVFKSEKYIRAQGKLLEATMHYRIQQREIIELILKTYDIPTRTEIDAVHRTNYELRKEIKALKKVIKATDKSAATQSDLAETRKTVAALQTEMKNANKNVVTSSELDEARQMITDLQKEIKKVNKDTATQSELAEAHQTIAALQEELKTLTATVTKLSGAAEKPKRSSSRTTATRKKTTTPKAKASKTEAAATTDKSEEGA
jgi:class III poly(R)-hydroxyalkanoic acid synthase PhaE subunit